jgi:transcriptional regulator
MAKKVTVSLHGIVKQIDQATAKLSAAQTKALTGIEKQRLTVKIKNLKKVRALVIQDCPKGNHAYNIIALEK